MSGPVCPQLGGVGSPRAWLWRRRQRFLASAASRASAWLPGKHAVGTGPLLVAVPAAGMARGQQSLRDPRAGVCPSGAVMSAQASGIHRSGSSGGSGVCAGPLGVHVLGREDPAPQAGCGNRVQSQVPLAAYEWLVCYLLRESHQKLNQEKNSGSSDFEARNNAQVYCCRSLALAFLELTVVRRFHEHTHQPGLAPSLQAPLRRLSALYSLWSLSQHMALLYRGGYCSGERAGKLMESAVLELCAQLKDDAVALVDVIAPPDFILDSPIGRADGELCRNLWAAVLQGSGVLERASWWPEFARKPVVGSLRSQL